MPSPFPGMDPYLEKERRQPPNLSVAAGKGAAFAGQSEPAIGPQNRDLSWEC